MQQENVEATGAEVVDGSHASGDGGPQSATKRRWAFKAVVLGDSGVGKTWLVETALTAAETLHQQQQPQQPASKQGEGDTAAPTTAGSEPGTIGVTFNLTRLELAAGTVMLQVWDTSGKDRYRGLLANYMTDLSCVIIAYNPCCESAETCCQSLARWHQLARETQATQQQPQPQPLHCVVAIGDVSGGCRSPRACDHVRCLAVGRAFAETLRGRFFQCRRPAAGDGGSAKCEWIGGVGGGGPGLTAEWLGQELLRAHFQSAAARSLAEAAESGDEDDSSAAKDANCCERLGRSLQELARLPVIAVLLLSRQLLPRS